MYIIYNNVTDEFRSIRNLYRSRMPPRRQRIIDAIRNKRYDDIKSLLDIHYVRRDTVSCSICSYTFRASIFGSRSRFSCQLCNGTFCQKCQDSITLGQDNLCDSSINVNCCKDCFVYYGNLQLVLSDSEPNDQNLIDTFKAYEIVLKIYKDMKTKLLQLQGYIQLLTLHNTLKEPLPQGTRQEVLTLLSQTTRSKKKLSEIKGDLRNRTVSDSCTITIHITKSLNTLLTTILYKIVPEFNKVTNKLKELDNQNVM